MGKNLISLFYIHNYMNIINLYFLLNGSVFIGENPNFGY